MYSVNRALFRRSLSLALRKQGVNVVPALSGLQVNTSQAIGNQFHRTQVRFNSTNETKTVVDGVSTLTDVAQSSTGTVLEQAAALASQGAAEVAVATEHSNFVIRGVMSLIENVHNLIGIPYWEAIVVTTIGLRFLLIPVVIKTTQGAARLAHLRPTLQKITDSMNRDPRSADMAVKARYQKEMQAAFLKHKVNPIHAMMWPFVQIPFFLSLFFAVQSMGTYYPGFEFGGMSWFTDLTKPDQYYIFPVFNALSFLAMIELGAQDGVQMEQTKNFKNIMRGLAVLTLPLTATMPQSVFVFWSTNNVLSIIQGIVLKQPGVKKALDIPEMPKPDESAPLKVSSPVDKIREYMQSKKNAADDAKSDILDGVSKPKVPTTPPPKTFNAPPRK